MRRSSGLALLALCAFAAARPVPAARALLRESRIDVPSSKSHVPSQKQLTDLGHGTWNLGFIQSGAPVVREIDVAGLKKLLARDEKGARPLLVNFWATWCEPCRAEFPDLVKIDGEFRQRGLDFIAVSIDDVAEINTTVPKFLEETGARMPVYLLNTPEPEAAINYVDPQWSGSLPATFLYDAHGKLVFKHLGRINPDELRKAIKIVISDK